MPGLKWPIQETYKDWRAHITINGDKKFLRVLPSRRLGLDMQTTTCAIEYTSLLDLASPFTWVDIDISIDPKTLGERIERRLFRGYIAPDTATYGASIQYPAVVTDPSYLLDTTNQTAITWTSTPFVDAVRQIWAAARIPETMWGHVLNPGYVYNLGVEYPIVIDIQQNMKSLIQQLMEFAGTAHVSLGDGKLHVVSGLEVPKGFSNIRYDIGRDNFDPPSSWGFEDMQRRWGVWSSVTESVTVTGPKRPDNFTPGYYFEVSPGIIPSGIIGRRHTINHAFIQNDTQCEAIAKRHIRRHARLEERVELRAPTHPTVLPGMTIMIRNPGLGYHTFQPALVLSQAIDGDGMTLVLSLNPSLVPGVGSPLGAYDDLLTTDPFPLPPLDPNQPGWDPDDFDDMVPPGFGPFEPMGPGLPDLPTWDGDPVPNLEPIAPPGFDGDFPDMDFDPVPTPTFPPIDLPMDFPMPWQPPFDFPPFLMGIDPAAVCVSYARPYIAEDDERHSAMASEAYWVNYASGTRYEWLIPDNGRIWCVNRERIGDMIWAAGGSRVYCAYDGAFLGVDVFDVPGGGWIHHIHTTDNVNIWVGSTTGVGEAGWEIQIQWSTDGGQTWDGPGLSWWGPEHYHDRFGDYNPMVGAEIDGSSWTFYFTNQVVTTTDGGTTWEFTPYDELNPAVRVSDAQHGHVTYVNGPSAVTGVAIGEASAASVHTSDETGVFTMALQNIWLDTAIHAAGRGGGSVFYPVNHYYYDEGMEQWYSHEQYFVPRIAVDGFHQVVHTSHGTSLSAQAGNPATFGASESGDLFVSCGVGLPVPPVIVTAHFASSQGWVSFVAGERYVAGGAAVSCVNRESVGDVLWAAGGTKLYRADARTLAGAVSYDVPCTGDIQRIYTDNANVYVVSNTGSSLEVWYHPGGAVGEGWTALHLGTGFDSTGHANAVAITVSGSLIVITTERGQLQSGSNGASWITMILRSGAEVHTDAWGDMVTMAGGATPFMTTASHAIGEEQAVSVYDEWTLGLSSLWRQGESYARAAGAGGAAYPYHRIVHHAADAILACTVGYAMYTKGNMTTPVVQNILAPGEAFLDVGL